MRACTRVMTADSIPDWPVKLWRRRTFSKVYYRRKTRSAIRFPARKMRIDVACFTATAERYNGVAEGEKTRNGARKLRTYGRSQKLPSTASGLHPASTTPMAESGSTRTLRLLMLATSATGILTSGWEGEIYMGGICQPVALWAGAERPSTWLPIFFDKHIHGDRKAIT
jgi:hypothetical protein